MKVFAQKAFRYNGTDYPYGWQDLPQSLADMLQSAGYVAPNDDPVKSARANSLADRPTAAAFGKGDLLIINPDYRINCTSDGVGWDSHGSSDSIADRPSASMLGKGTWRAGPYLYSSNGLDYINEQKFSPLQLKKWRSALSNAMAGGSSAKIMVIGDSTDNGAYADVDISIGAYALTVSEFLAKILSNKGIPINVASRLNFSGAEGVGSVIAANDPRWSIGAGWVCFSGFLRNTADLTSANFTPVKVDGITPEIFDTITIKYVKNSTDAAIEVSVDGGAVAGTSTQGGASSIGTVIVAVTRAAHTVNIKKVAGDIAKTVYVMSISCSDSTKSEVVLLNNGFNAYKSSDMSSLASFGYLTHVKTYSPHLSIINCLINDTMPQTAIATYKSNIQTIITNCKLTGDVVLRTGNPIQNGYSTYVTGNEIPYISALYDLAASNNIPIIDTWTNLVDWVDANANGFIVDPVHPNKIGYNDIANTIAPYIINH